MLPQHPGAVRVPPGGLTQRGLLPALLRSCSEDALQRSSAEVGGRVRTGVRACPSPATLQSFPSRGACWFWTPPSHPPPPPQPHGLQVPGQGRAGDTDVVRRRWWGNGDGHMCTLTRHRGPLTPPPASPPFQRATGMDKQTLDKQMAVLRAMGSLPWGGCLLGRGVKGFQTAPALRRERNPCGCTHFPGMDGVFGRVPTPGPRYRRPHRGISPASPYLPVPRLPRLPLQIEMPHPSLRGDGGLGWRRGR